MNDSKIWKPKSIKITKEISAKSAPGITRKEVLEQMEKDGEKFDQHAAAVTLAKNEYYSGMDRVRYLNDEIYASDYRRRYTMKYPQFGDFTLSNWDKFYEKWQRIQDVPVEPAKPSRAIDELIEILEPPATRSEEKPQNRNAKNTKGIKKSENRMKNTLKILAIEEKPYPVPREPGPKVAMVGIDTPAFTPVASPALEGPPAEESAEVKEKETEITSLLGSFGGLNYHFGVETPATMATQLEVFVTKLKRIAAAVFDSAVHTGVYAGSMLAAYQPMVKDITEKLGLNFVEMAKKAKLSWLRTFWSLAGRYVGWNSSYKYALLCCVLVIFMFWRRYTKVTDSTIVTEFDHYALEIKEKLDSPPPTTDERPIANSGVERKHNQSLYLAVYKKERRIRSTRVMIRTTGQSHIHENEKTLLRYNERSLIIDLELVSQLLHVRNTTRVTSPKVIMEKLSNSVALNQYINTNRAQILGSDIPNDSVTAATTIILNHRCQALMSDPHQDFFRAADEEKLVPHLDPQRSSDLWYLRFKEDVTDFSFMVTGWAKSTSNLLKPPLTHFIAKLLHGRPMIQQFVHRFALQLYPPLLQLYHDLTLLIQLIYSQVSPSGWLAHLSTFLAHLGGGLGGL